jgi:KDO2-lipid IV(A) lauroyltransferase
MTNFFLNALVYFSRKRFSNKLLALKNMPRQIVELVKSGQPMALALIADQWPPPKTATNVNFLGVETPFYNGIEKIARKYEYPVIFISARKQPDGRYSIFAAEIASKPSDLPPKEITRKYVSLLENEIKTKPEYWLWSHRRWKEMDK